MKKRSKLSNKRAFDEVRNRLKKCAKFLGKKEMKSYLFQEPTPLRIRLIKGSNEVLITEKSGSYSDAGRLESGYKIPLDELPMFVAKKLGEGYAKCSLFHTERLSYQLKGLMVELK